MASSLIQTLEEVWSRLDLGAALADLNPRKTGERIYCRCPQCNEPSGWVLPGQKEINCNRENNCGRRTNILARFIGKTQSAHLTGDDFTEALRRACKTTGVPFPEKEYSESAKRYKEQKDAYTAIWEVARGAMQHVDPLDPNPGFLHLLDRGFNPEFIADNFGFIDNPADLLSVIDGTLLRAAGIVDNSGNAVESWRLRVVVPAADAAGKLVGLIGRTVDPNCPPGEKYRYATGYAPSKYNGFGLDVAKRHNRIVLVEGVLDVLKARQEGIENLVAAGTNNFSVDHLLALSSIGVREVVAALDSDTAGNKGLWSILNASDESGDCPEVFVFDDYRGTKDPDEYITQFGATVFRNALASATHGLRHRAREWGRQYDFAKDGQLTAFVERCAAYGNSFTSARTRTRLNTYFLPEVAEISGLDLNDIKAIHSEIHQRAEEKRRVDALVGRLQDAVNLARDGDSSAAAELANDAAKAILHQTGATIYVSRIPQGPEIITEVEEKLRKYASREFIGLPTRSLPTLDRLLHGLRGFILLAGGTNVGKTLLLGQLALNIVDNNLDACVLFLSLEMSRSTILQRMWSNLANSPFVEFLDSFRGNEGENNHQAIWDARTQLDGNYRRNIRIWHPRSDGNAATQTAIQNEVDDLRRQTGRNRCMLIVDYLDVLPVPAGLERATQAERERAWCDQMIDLKAEIGEDNPIVAVSTMRKRKGDQRSDAYDTEDMMGSAHKGYSGDTDILWNKWSDRQLLEQYEALSGDYLRRRREQVDYTDSVLRKREVREELRAIKDHFSKRGVSQSRLEITKVRDGGTKGEIDIIVDYHRNRIREGIYI